MSDPSQAQLNNQQQRFYLPKSNILSNDRELKQMRRNMLKQQYDKQIKDKHQRQNVHNKNNPEYYGNSRINQYLNNHINDTQKIERNLKTMLAQQYKQEMKRKEHQKRQQRQAKLQNQLYQNQRVSNIQTAQYNYAHNANNQYKKQVLKDLEQRQFIRKNRKQQQQQQNNYFRRHYSQPKFGTDKRKSFQQYYAALQQHRKAIEDDYIKKTSKIQKQRQQQKDRIVNNAIYEKQIKVQRDIQRQYLASERNRQNLRDSLMKQIQEKQRYKKEEKYKARMEPYTLDEFKRMHHPINNPVDFRITHDNRYIIQQIQGRGTQENHMSELARSGSHALLS